MQENKFRGVSQYTGEMVYGQLLRGENNFNIVTKFNRVDDIELVPIKKGTQGLFTGLKAKNGKEIYDGDVLSYWGFTYVVKYQDGAFGWIEDGEFHSFASMAISEISKTKNIGNIHENPELVA